MAPKSQKNEFEPKILIKYGKMTPGDGFGEKKIQIIFFDFRPQGRSLKKKVVFFFQKRPNFKKNADF